LNNKSHDEIKMLALIYLSWQPRRKTFFKKAFTILWALAV